MKHPIPDAVLAQHIAVLGKTGSGKTSTEKVVVEQVVDEGFRVCVLDTLKSDWWGITSSASGKSAGLPFKILGGPHGHVPLHSSAGKAIGHLVGSGKLPLSIIDMADFEPGGIQRFFVDFAQSLWKSTRGVVYLVIEEAHEVAPKERAGFNAENMAIHWAKKLATGSRTKGIRLIVATQSVQQLHNRVLGSCETLIAHRIGTPADQEPVVKWMKANADKKTTDDVAATLSSLPTGTGWICSGEARIFEKVAFPKFKTYDNTATPTGDSAEIAVKTAPVDQDELRSIIGDAVKEAEANDPKVLKADIARLTAELKKAQQNIPQNIPDAAAIDVADQAGYHRGLNDGYQHGWRAGWPDGFRGGAYVATTAAAADIGKVADDLRSVDQRKIAIPKIPDPLGGPSPSGSPPRNPTPRARPERTAIPPRAKPPSPAASGDGTLTNPQRTLLRSLAWWKAMGHDEPSRPQVAAIAGWTPKGSNLKDRLSEVSSRGLVIYPRTGHVALTPEGIAAAPEPDTSQTLIASITTILTGPQLKLFEALLEFQVCGKSPVSRHDLASDVGWEPSGSNLKDRLSELSRLELVEYPQRGLVALQDWVTA